MTNLPPSDRSGRHRSPADEPPPRHEKTLTPPPGTGQRVGDLDERLDRAFSHLTTRVGAVEQRLTHTERHLRIAAAALAIMVVFVVTLGAWANAQLGATQRLDVRQVIAETEQVRTAVAHREALCRATRLTLGARHDTARRDYAAGPLAYDEALAAVRRSATELGCITGMRSLMWLGT